MSTVIYDHRGGPDRMAFTGSGDRMPLLDAPDCRKSASHHISGRAWTDKYVFNAKSDDLRYWLEARGGIQAGSIIPTHVVPMLHPFFGTQMRIRCGCPDMVISIKAFPIICNPDGGNNPPYVIDEDNAVDLAPGVSLNTTEDTYIHMQPPVPGAVSLQNWVVGVVFDELPEGGLFGNCCNQGCCPHFEIITMGHEPCWRESFQGDCGNGRCSGDWTPPEKCVAETACGEFATVTVIEAPEPPLSANSAKKAAAKTVKKK